MARPLKFKSANDFNQLASKYFIQAKMDEEPITITGLCLALETTRDVLIDYEKGLYDEHDPEFSYAIKRAKMIVENAYEQRLSGNNPTGAIFALKNFGWADKLAIGGADDLPPIQAAVTVEFVKPKTE